ncbi:unnamed protein product, partial [Rhizoctonia solani]
SRGPPRKETDAPPKLLEEFSHKDGTVLAILAVPSYIGPSDLLAWTSPAAEGIQHLRIVHDNQPNRSMAIIKFRSKADANLFQETYNGRQFTPMEPETCHVVRVLSNFGDVRTADLPGLLGKDGHGIDWAHNSRLLTYFPLLLFEQMGGRAMPCLPLFANDVGYASTLCDANLWICLICGNIGCGRYARAHAHAHHEFSAHLYALELATQRVWDYAGDGYVHRLIHDRTEGKLVELPSSSNTLNSTTTTGGESSLGPGPDDMRAAEKVEAVGLEYANLLASQLDSQRAYFEEQAAELRSALDSSRQE